MALTVSKKKVEETAPVAEAVADVRVKEKAKAEAVAPTYDESKLGSMSGAVEFVAPLGDPSHPDTTTDKEGNKTITPFIVGYRFKALQDIEVPECGLDKDARKNLMSYIPEQKNNKKAVKAGETFDLTRFEAALLLASVEFNGAISGGDKTFIGVYQTKTMNSKKGTVGTTSAATALPTFVLKAAGAGSIKDYEIIKVLTFVSETVNKDKDGNPITRKKRTIVPGFEKWEPLCLAQAPTKSATGGAKKTPTNRRNANAEAFLQLVARK